MYKVNNLIIKQLNRWKGVILNIQTLITATVSPGGEIDSPTVSL